MSSSPPFRARRDAQRVRPWQGDNTTSEVSERAGWPDGDNVEKARAAARMICAEPFPGWYDEWLEIHDDEPRPNLVIPLANGRAVRRAVAARDDALVVHATTGDGWTAELHRHLRGRDDCISCRIPEEERSAFICATGELAGADGMSTDAALPFLSAAAGLLLVRFLDAMSPGEESLSQGIGTIGQFPSDHRASRSRV